MILPELHQIMLGFGFQFLAIRKRRLFSFFDRIDPDTSVYIKDYETSEGHFTVALMLSDEPHTILPKAQILKRPEEIEHILLAHINSGGYLCYVEEQEADWNPNNLQGLYKAIDEQVQKTLEISVASLQDTKVDQIEFEGELVSYWKPEQISYVLSDYQSLNGKEVYLTYNAHIDDLKGKELVIYDADEKEIYQKWLRQRGLSQEFSKKYSSFVLKVRPDKLSGVKWPLNDTVQLLQWLSQVDHNAKAKLVQYLVENPSKHHLIFLDINKQDTFGVLLELNLKAVQFNSYANYKKAGKNGRQLDVKRASSVLMGKQAFLKFKRIAFEKADSEAILTRNRSKPEVGDLRSKRIALIGCGTVGGYTAELLIRSGAGMGLKSLDLYDADDFDPENFSRHALSSSDFGKNKAIALKAHLENSTHLVTNIQAYARKFELSVNRLKSYDIIIDSTGRAPIAKRLAYLVRQLRHVKNPVVIHGFNDGNGLASKVFIDRLDGCYNCLCGNNVFYKNGNDKRFENLIGLPEKKVSCGNTYTPYDAAVSIMTAALIQEAALSLLENNLDWNYKEHLFLGGRTKKTMKICKQNFCDICNDV